MGLIKKSFVIAIAVLMINFYLPNIFIPVEANLYADEIKTKHPLEIRKTPEVEMAEKEEQVKSNWLLLGLLGAAVVGGVAAMAGGGGDSGGGGGDEPTGGSIVGSW
jgi:hypothetical protein